MKELKLGDRFKDKFKTYTVYDVSNRGYGVAVKTNGSDYEYTHITKQKLNKLSKEKTVTLLPPLKSEKAKFRNIVFLEKERANGRKTWIVKDGFGFYNWELDFYSGKYFSVSQINTDKEVLIVDINSKKELAEVFKITKQWFVSKKHIVHGTNEIKGLYSKLKEYKRRIY